MRAVAIEKYDTGKFGVDPKYWFKTITEKIEIMKEIENYLTKDIVTEINVYEYEKNMMFIKIIILSILIMVFCILSGIYTANSIVKEVKKVSAVSNEIAQGNLTIRLKTLGKDEIGEMGENFNEFLEKLSDIICKIKNIAGQLSESAIIQAESISETSSTLHGITVVEKNNGDRIIEMNRCMQETKDATEKAKMAVIELEESIKNIEMLSKKISKITKTIDDISFQTNILALNAAVESARAGEMGAGFSIVAEEVRKLAEKTAEATKNIAVLISETVEKIDYSVEKSAQTNKEFNIVDKSALKVTELTKEVSQAFNEQHNGIEQINKAIMILDKELMQNAEYAKELIKKFEHFRIGGKQ